MTYLHAYLKSNPEGSIDLWVSEKKKPTIEFFKSDTGTGTVYYNKDFKDALEKWQSSLVCFPTLPEQRQEIVFRVLEKDGCENLDDGFDIDPGLFEFIHAIGCQYAMPVEKCNCKGVAVLKSTPAQEEEKTLKLKLPEMELSSYYINEEKTEFEWLAVLKGVPGMVVSAPTKEKAINELMISIRLTLVQEWERKQSKTG